MALSGLDDRTIDLAGAHGDAGEADFVQATDRVDIATVLAADEDFELRIDGAGVSDEAADHLDDCRWGGMDGRAFISPNPRFLTPEYIPRYFVFALVLSIFCVRLLRRLVQ